MNGKRIYEVYNKAGVVRLIDAVSKQQAVAFVAAQEYTAKVATARVLVGLMGAGIVVEDACPEKEPE